MDIEIDEEQQQKSLWLNVEKEDLNEDCDRRTEKKSHVFLEAGDTTIPGIYSSSIIHTTSGPFYFWRD